MKTTREDVLEITKVLYQQEAQIIDLVAELVGFDITEEAEDLDEYEFVEKISAYLAKPTDPNLKEVAELYHSIRQKNDLLKKNYNITTQEIEQSIDDDFRDFKQSLKDFE